MGKLRIALAGAGAIGRAHMDVLARSTAMELCALVDPAQTACALAFERQVPWFETLDAMLDAVHPDGVILATPNALHVSQALQCIDAGIPVLVEKPIAHTVAEAERLVHVAERHFARVLIGHHRAHSPIMASARQVVQSGQLGPLVCVAGSATFYKPDSYFSEAPWRKAPGGGPILINLIHEIHNLRMLCGEIEEVQALTSNAIRGHAVEDTAVIGMRFSSGVLGTFLLSDAAASPRSWEQTSQENPAYATYSDEDCYVISGTKGTLSVPSMRLTTYANATTRSWFTPMQTEQLDLQRENPLDLQMAHFADVIMEKAVPLVSPRDGLRNLQVVEAIAQAAAAGQTVLLK